MANSFTGNVIFVDTTASTFAYAKNICGIRYIGNTSGTLQIQADNVSGAVLWAGSGSSDLYEEVEIRSSDGVYVALTNGASAYIYLK